MNKYLYLFILFSVSLQAQVIQVARFETPLFDETSDYKVLPWQQNGVIVYRRIEFPKTDAIELIKLDSSLNEDWVKSISVSKQLTLIFSKGYRDMAYFLFKPRVFYGDFQLFSISSDSSTTFLYTIKNVIPFNPTMFEVSNNSLVIAGYYNYRPVAIHYSLVTGLSKLLPGFFNDPGELNQLNLNRDESIDVLINFKNADRRRSLRVTSYSAEGSSIKSTIIDPPLDKNLIFGRMMKSSGDSLIIVGVYGKNAEYSRGIFVASVNPTGEYTIRYYNFGDLKNFFKYLRVGRQNRIKERIERKKVKGKKLRFNYRVAVHEFIPYQDHFLLLGEAFYPVYRSSSYSNSRLTPIYFGNYFSPSSRQSNDFTFDGYRYTHAVTIGIAKDGRLLWDNSFEIKDVKSYTLDQYVHILNGSNLNLLYSYNNKLYTKIVKGTEVLEDKSEDQIKGKYKGDKIKKNTTTSHRLEYWYGNYLLSYGEQEIQNTQTFNVPLNREVFFINKITYHEHP